jgi:sec-independent protein translocase protein TatA
MKTILLFLGGIGMQEILLIGIVVLVFFGAKKIPEFMKGLGKGVREFKDGVKEMKNDIDNPVVPPANQNIEAENLNNL